MKKTLKLIAAILMVPMLLSAQFIPGPTIGNIFTTLPVNLTAPTTNFAGSAVQGYIPVGPRGVGLQMTLYAPNTGTKALVVTNCNLTFQGSVNGSDWINLPFTAANVNWTITPNADAVYTVYTNILPNVVASQNAGNLRWLRPSWFTNGNGTNVIVCSNAVWSVLQ
jgi:hypothetical protein